MNAAQCGWLEFIKSILIHSGSSDVFDHPNRYTTSLLITDIEITLKDQFIQVWRTNITESPKGYYYNVLNIIPFYEPYL
jgi:hypothetical protein